MQTSNFQLPTCGKASLSKLRGFARRTCWVLDYCGFSGIWVLDVGAWVASFQDGCNEVIRGQKHDICQAVAHNAKHLGWPVRIAASYVCYGGSGVRPDRK